MTKTYLMMKFSFWGILVWFPATFMLLIAAELKIFNEAQMHVVGDIAASLFILFSVPLWLMCIVKLIKNWNFRSSSRNYCYLLLLFVGTIIGSLIFYIVEKGEFEKTQKRD